MLYKQLNQKCLAKSDLQQYVQPEFPPSFLYFNGRKWAQTAMKPEGRRQPRLSNSLVLGPPVPALSEGEVTRHLVPAELLY